MPNNTLENKIKLKPYYVAYMDILDMQDIMCSDKSEEYLNKIHQLYAEAIATVEINKETRYSKKGRFKIFSDNIVYAIPLGEFTVDNMQDLMISQLVLLFVAFFQIIALKYSFLIRGGVCIDNLYIDDDFIYGRALTQAYKLESEISIYPRIILNPKDVYLFTKSTKQRKAILKDSANVYYLDPFECVFNYLSPKPKPTLYDMVYEELKKILIVSDDKRNQKTCWFVNMFNSFCKRHGYKQYVINTEKFPYDPDKIKTIYTAGRRKEALENAK